MSNRCGHTKILISKLRLQTVKEFCNFPRTKRLFSNLDSIFCRNRPIINAFFDNNQYRVFQKLDQKLILKTCQYLQIEIPKIYNLCCLFQKCPVFEICSV